MNWNKATLLGRLTRDPEQKALPSGTNVTTFSVATSSTYTDRDGQKQEETEYHTVVVFGKQAEACGTYLAKGQLVAVEGKLKTRSWENEGVKHYRTEIVADRVQFGPKAGGSGDNRPDEADEPLTEEEVPF